MSGAEVSPVIGLIGSIITIIEATYSVYEAVKDEKGLPANFNKAASKLPLIKTILVDAEKYVESPRDEDEKAAFKFTLESCKLQAIKLQGMFTKVMPDEADSRWERYVKARTIGKGSRLEDLIGGLLDNLQLMTTNFPEVITPRSKEDLGKAVHELSKIEHSLPDSFEESPAFTNFGSGAQNVNIGVGSQYNNNGTGNQNNGPGQQYIDQRVTVHNNTVDMISECLQYLRTTDPDADMDRIESTKDPLLKNCYSWILKNQNFQYWQNNDNCRLLWMNGDPGKGKTMLMIALVHELRESVSNGCAKLAFFFCQSTEPALNKADSVLRSLTWKLVHKDPQLAQDLLKEYRAAGKKLLDGPSATNKIWSILSKILNNPALPKAYILIDAIDECDTGWEKLLRFITQNAADPSSKAKWLISSRNYPKIEETLNLQGDRRILNLELNSSHVSQAVNIFIDSRTNELARRKGYSNDIRLEVDRQLKEKAESTFLWAALVFKELEQVYEWDVRSVLREMPPGLEPLYGRMILQIRQLQRNGPEFCRLVLSAITLAHRPLHLLELGALSSLPEEISNNLGHVKKVVNDCGSFLTIRQDRTYFIHQSAKDFLLGPAFHEVFRYSILDMNSTFFRRSIEIMSKTLRHDIYGLHTPGIRIDQVKHPDPDPLIVASYSCVYWVDHLFDSGPTQTSTGYVKDSSLVYQFLWDNFLYWLEALSILRSLSSSIVMIRKLENWLKVDESSNLYEFVHDAKRFTLYNRAIIEQAPLQIYSAGLIFAPEESIVRRRFQNCVPPWIRLKSKMRAKWSAALQTLEGHSSVVQSVTFSPDGRQLASGSYDHTIRLWDAATGAALQTLEGHSDVVGSVAFSPDGRQLASGSHDSTIRLWDAATGTALQMLEGHSSVVESVAFSPDGMQLASGSYDRTIRLWDAAIGAELQTLDGHSDRVESVAFSPDGMQLASGSFDGTIRLWDAATGAAMQMLDGHSDGVVSVAFSPDGRQLASGSFDGTIRLWDAATGAELQILDGHSDGVESVAFSPDGRQLASGSFDCTIQLWDAATGATLQTLEGHSNGVESVAFSPDGRQLASGSHDSTIWLWDAATGAELQTLEGHSDEVESVVFSPDGRQLASGSYDSTIRLWDAATGAALQTLEGHSGGVVSVAFSPDGRQLASGSYDSTIRLWDAATGATLQTLEGHSGVVGSMAFSPDGRQLALGSLDSTIQLWDAATGAALQILEGHSSLVQSVAFSPDGRQLASGSFDGTIRLWAAATGATMQTLEGHSDGVVSVAFSPDGRQLASGSYDCTIRLWDAATGAALQTLEGHSKGVGSVTFSPDGRQLASGSYDCTIRLWDAATGAALQTLEGHSSLVESVAFLPDGRQLASGSYDCTIRFWDAATGAALQTLEGHSSLVESVAFSPDNRYLQTNRGTKRIGSSLSTNVSLILPSKTNFSIEDQWIRREEDDFLWLPREYRSAITAVCRRSIAMGCRSGQVLVFELQI